MQVLQANDGFLWADVTNIAKELWNSGNFELFAINTDNSESKIEDDNQLIETLAGNSKIVIELCFFNEINQLN